MQLPLLGDGEGNGLWDILRLASLTPNKRQPKAADPLPLLSAGDGGRKTTIRDLTLPTINLPL